MAKFDLSFSPPYLNAAGILGFAPDPHGPYDLSRLGAFVTNPISPNKRSPASGIRYQSFPGGFLLHSGYPNPGLNPAIRLYSRRWERSALPVIVHLLANSPNDVAGMVRCLEHVEGVMGIELGIPPDSMINEAVALLQAAEGELPVIACFPFERVLQLAPNASHVGAAAVSLAAPRGTLPGARGELIQGRLYGPALFPLALATVRHLAQLGLPTIASGGIYGSHDAEAMLSAGAMAVQVDAVLWRGGIQPINGGR